MKHLRQTILHAAVLASLLLAAATVVLWLRGTDWIRRGYALSQRPDSGDRADIGMGSVGLFSQDGRIGFAHIESGKGSRDPEEREAAEPPDPSEIGWVWTRSGELPTYHGGVPDDVVPTYVSWHVPGCAYFCSIDEMGMAQFTRGEVVLVNDPVVLALTLAPGIAYGVSRLRRRRRLRRRGACLACGYDLRATRTRCPECGRSVQATPVPGN